MSRLITADASKITGKQFIEAIFGEPRCEWDRMIDAAVRRGDHEAAAGLRNAKRQVYAAFDVPMTEVHGDPLLDRLDDAA
jgi:hypothetical protein